METTAEELTEIDNIVKRKMVDDYNAFRENSLQEIEDNIKSLSDEQIMSEYKSYYGIPANQKI